MPSFLERLRRLVNGEPIFRPGEDTEDPQYSHDKDDWDTPPQAHTPPQQPAQALVPRVDGPKIIPLVTVEEAECHPSGQNMEVTLHIRNHAAGNIFLDKVLLFGRTRELDFDLGPGKREEFTNVYYGPRPTNRNYTHAEVQYRDEHGDYFSAIHNVEFDQESDGTYVIRKLRFIPPVKDI